jgi:hypothetical protein
MGKQLKGKENNRSGRARAEASAISAIVRAARPDLADFFAHEAEHCRHEADHFLGKPEQQFLLRLASTFDDLAASNRLPHPVRPAR